MAIIYEPKLPFKVGYVEDQDGEGNPFYVPTPETIKAITDQQRSDDNDELILDMLYRMTLLEWGVN